MGSLGGTVRLQMRGMVVEHCWVDMEADIPQH